LSKRGELIKQEFIAGKPRRDTVPHAPRRIVIDFYDKLRASAEDTRPSTTIRPDSAPRKLVKLDILLNGESVDALSTLTNIDNSVTLGRRMCERLKELLAPRQQFDIAIQAAIEEKSSLSETVKQVRKDVTAKCFGGDVSRKRKLLEKTKTRKKTHEADWQRASSAESIPRRAEARRRLTNTSHTPFQAIENTQELSMNYSLSCWSARRRVLQTSRRRTQVGAALCAASAEAGRSGPSTTSPKV
jgi:hypothetical protein